MADLTQLLLSLCGGISVVGGAAAILWRWLKPVLGVQTRVAEIERKLSHDFDAIHSLAALNQTQNLALLAMINHMIDGNSIDALKKTHDRMQRELLQTDVNPK